MRYHAGLDKYGNATVYFRELGLKISTNWWPIWFVLTLFKEWCHRNIATKYVFYVLMEIYFYKLSRRDWQIENDYLYTYNICIRVFRAIPKVKNARISMTDGNTKHKGAFVQFSPVTKLVALYKSPIWCPARSNWCAVNMKGDVFIWTPLVYRTE